MSTRKEQQRQAQPIFNILKSALKMQHSEIISELNISQGIVEQAIQTDIISKIQYEPTLKFIIYQLIIHYYQHAQIGKSNNEEKVSLPQKMMELLASMKKLLNDLVNEKELTLISLNHQVNRHGDRQSKLYMNKLRILTSYFNQYYSMVDQKDKKVSKRKETDNKKDMEKQQALVDQLQMLVYKKEQQLQESLNQKNILQNQISRLSEQLSAFRLQYSILNKENMKLKVELEDLKDKVKVLQDENHEYFIFRELRNSQQIQKHHEEQISSLSFSKDFTRIQQIQEQRNQQTDGQLLRLLMSQAMTIEAFLQ